MHIICLCMELPRNRNKNSHERNGSSFTEFLNRRRRGKDLFMFVKECFTDHNRPVKHRRGKWCQAQLALAVFMAISARRNDTDVTVRRPVYHAMTVWPGRDNLTFHQLTRALHATLVIQDCKALETTHYRNKLYILFIYIRYKLFSIIWIQIYNLNLNIFSKFQFSPAMLYRGKSTATTG